MPAKKMPVSLRVLREAIERQIEASSLRHVAAEIGMSPSTLHAFIQATFKEPYSKNYQKLLAWYVSDAQEAKGITADSAVASLELLTRHFPPKRRRSVQQRLLEVLEQLGGDEVSTPQWVSEVKRR